MQVWKCLKGGNFALQKELQKCHLSLYTLLSVKKILAGYFVQAEISKEISKVHVCNHLVIVKIYGWNDFRAYHYAMDCAERHTAWCSSDQKQGLTYIQDYVQSVVGETCPFVQALKKCYTGISNNNECNIRKAKECISVLGDYSRGVTKQTCR